MRGSRVSAPPILLGVTLCCFKGIKQSGGFPNALGCRPFFTEKEPLALFPGVQNPPETPSAIA